jgi:hypothetical protein
MPLRSTSTSSIDERRTEMSTEPLNVRLTKAAGQAAFENGAPLPSAPFVPPALRELHQRHTLSQQAGPTESKHPREEADGDQAAAAEALAKSKLLRQEDVAMAKSEYLQWLERNPKP